jgi:hypothetical protein
MWNIILSGYVVTIGMRPSAKLKNYVANRAVKGIVPRDEYFFKAPPVLLFGFYK